MKTTLFTLVLNILLMAAVNCRGHRFKDSIDNINSLKKQGKLTWSAKNSDEIDLDSDDDLKSRCGLDLTQLADLENEKNLNLKNEGKGNDLLSCSKRDRKLQTVTPPASVDLRILFPICTSIKLIRNQSGCGSCWAFGSATSLSDRFCINSVQKGGFKERSFSYQDVLENTSTSLGGYGCRGGGVSSGFKFAKQFGIVTGELYGDYKLCKPYFLAPNTSGSSPPANTVCNLKSTYPILFQNDKVKITSYNYLYGATTLASVTNMMNAISLRGSIMVGFNVYACFYLYSKGIYTVTSTTLYGGHAVRVLGYGTENGVDFWICANSWGAYWGESGFFRIKKGVNMAGIESFPIEGVL